MSDALQLQSAIDKQVNIIFMKARLYDDVLRALAEHARAHGITFYFTEGQCYFQSVAKHDRGANLKQFDNAHDALIWLLGEMERRAIEATNLSKLEPRE